MKKNSLIIFALTASALTTVAASASSKSYMSDKTEISVDLEVSGAEAICQTADGYVWIAQYSGLTRYDSKEYVTYKSFTEGDNEYSVVNVRALETKDNTLFVATYKNIFTYEDYHFSVLDVGEEVGTIKDIALDAVNDLLYIASFDSGATLYDLKNETATKLPNLETGLVNDIALDVKRDNYYYQTNDGVYDKTGKEIYSDPYVLDVYTSDDVLYIGNKDGLIKRYDLDNNVFLADISVPDQINKFLYSPEDDILFVACENSGLYCVNLAFDTPVISLAGDLINKSQLVDLMIDYEGNLWVASHYIGASGLSIITKNALLELLYDDTVWQGVAENERSICAIEKYGDILYIATNKCIYLYDTNEGKILPDNAIMDLISTYSGSRPRDIEVFNNKVYFAIQNAGLAEYDPATNTAIMYDSDYITSHLSSNSNETSLEFLIIMRSLRATDNFLAIGYSQGIMKFDGETFTASHDIKNKAILFIGQSNEGKLLYCSTQGIYEIDDNFETVKELPTAYDVDGNILKFLVDGDYIYYTKNSRLFRMSKVNDEYVSKEVTVPYAKGSLVELSKIAYKGKDGNTFYKYVIASQTQIYITDSLEGDQLSNYEFYDSTNGLKTIAANTSGFYDAFDQKYYFQSTNGIFVYDFNEERNVSVPIKIDANSIELDGVSYYGNLINIKKDTYRITINLSILGFKPHKGYNVYYKLEGIDKDYHLMGGDDYSINFTNLAGGSYTFRAYATDEYGQKSNEVVVTLIKEKKIVEHIWFWIVAGILALAVVVGIAFLIIRQKTRQALKKQLEYKNITVESIQAIARTIDAKDEYTNGHSTRVGYYSRLIAENLGLSEEEVDNIYYIALLHDIGKIAIPDKILNKPGRLTDDEFAVMKSHTTRGAKILKGISTIPHIIEGAKSHHEKWDGTGYPDGLKGEEIPYVARIICCADCFDAMATKRVYKEPISLENIAQEFKRCEGTHFDPEIAEVVVNMMNTGKLKPYTAENVYYLGDDGKTHRIERNTDKTEQ